PRRPPSLPAARCRAGRRRSPPPGAAPRSALALHHRAQAWVSLPFQQAEAVVATSVGALLLG
ncbi:hypothetical protein, partial [Micromonospora saelicesensis]|uniref:hypothetical protein n=1 Tax=Micromonospora saelicesensis TaxID=285676 RepID=UPI001C65B202